MDKQSNKYVHLKSFAITVLVFFTGYGVFLFLKNLDSGGKKKETIPYQLEVAPDFQFEKVFDKKSLMYDTSDLKDGLLIINFWASWCSPCVEEIPSLIKLVNKFEGKIRLIAISNDNQLQDIEVFSKSFPELKNGKYISVVWDKNRDLALLFNINRLPESHIVEASTKKILKKIVGTTNWYTDDSVSYFKEKLR